MKNKLFLILAVIFLFQHCATKPTPEITNIPFQNGDLVFRKGVGMASRFITNTDKSGVYSHVGIMVSKNNDWYVVHAVPGENKKGEPETIKMETPEVFFCRKRAKSGAVMRVIEPGSFGETAAKLATSIFERGITFDHEYNLDDTLKMYCTELVWHAYMQAGIDITNAQRTQVNFAMFNGSYIFPSDIYNNDNLVCIQFFKY